MVTEKRRITAARTYYGIARRHAESFHDYDRRRAALEKAPTSEEALVVRMQEIETNYERQQDAAMIAVTFSAMALEAFLFDYASDVLGDTYVLDHLDKLDLRSKYLIYPRLVCGEAPDKSEHTFQLVRKLTTLRNDLVHSKSKAFASQDLEKAANHYDDFTQKLREGVAFSVACVKSVMQTLDKLHGTSTFETYMESS